MVARFTVFVYGVVCRLILFATFIYSIGFIGDLVVPKSIDLGQRVALLQAMLVDGALLALFAFQQSAIVRQWFKRFWTDVIPEPAQRSTYLLFSSLLLLVLFWQWRPIDDIVWDIESSLVRIGLYAVYGLGWLAVVASKVLKRSCLGRCPLYLGWLMVFWATPTMTAGHLLFAIATTSYILVAIEFDERNGMLESYAVSFRRNHAWANRRSWRTT